MQNRKLKELGTSNPFKTKRIYIIILVWQAVDGVLITEKTIHGPQ
jgi:hypothetical protein